MPADVREIRSATLSGVQIRSKDANTAEFTGYASVFDSPTRINDFMGSYRETIRPGAFRRAIAERQSVPLLYNHDGVPVARYPGTMRLSEDKRGLRVEATLDRRQSFANDLCIALERGDLSKMSFSFAAVGEEWDQSYSERSVSDVDLYDVAIVAMPAYKDTDAGLKPTVQDAAKARARQIVADHRVGKVLSSGNETLLNQALDAIKQATEAVSKVVSASVPADPSDSTGAGDPDDVPDENTDGLGARYVPPSVQAARDAILLERMRMGGNLRVGAAEKLSPALRAKLAGERAEQAHRLGKAGRSGKSLLDHHRRVRWEVAQRVGKGQGR